METKERQLSTKTPEEVMDEVEKRIDPEIEWFNEHIREGLIAAVKNERQLYWNKRSSDEYKEAREFIEEEILKPINHLGRKKALREARKVVRREKLFYNIRHSLERLESWIGGNPWYCLNTRAQEAAETGMARRATRAEVDQIKSRDYPETWIRFQGKSRNGRPQWEYIVPLRPDSERTQKLFDLLHKLRIKAREVASRNQ